VYCLLLPSISLRLPSTVRSEYRHRSSSPQCDPQLDYRLLIARRYLATRRGITLISVVTGISVAGVTLGVAALVVVLSVMNGFYDFVRDLLVSIDPHIRIVAVDDRGFEEVEEVRALASGMAHVEDVSSYVEGKALLLYEGFGEVNKVVVVRGVAPETLAGLGRVSAINAAEPFDVSRIEGRPGIVMGASLGQRLGVGPGMSVGLMSAPAIERMLTQAFAPPAIVRFDVRGLYELEAVYDESHAFIDITEAQRLFRMGSRVSGIELRLDDIDRAGRVQQALQARLDPERYQVLTWYDLQRQLYDVMRLEKWGATAILLLIIVVAAFNIVGSLTMIVIEKRRDIGVLQAMGVSRRDIRRIFLSEGALIGIVGTGFGLAIGLGLAFLQQQYGLVELAGADAFVIQAYPVSIQALDVILVALSAMGLCVLAALYPAIRASRVQPAAAVNLEG
jgi:lipoprotein-releasing system permease protein